MNALLEVQILKVHFPVKLVVFSRVGERIGFDELTLG